MHRSTVIGVRPATPAEVLAEIPSRAGLPGWQDVRIIICECKPPPKIADFPLAFNDIDPEAAAGRVLQYLKEHAPEEAGPAALAFQARDAARVAAVVKAFDRQQSHSREWSAARHDAALVYQALTASSDERLASHIIWLASDAHPGERFLVTASRGVLPALRQRYGKQVYAIGGVPRELLGGPYFLDIASVPRETPLGRWLVAQKFPFDGILGE